jgi:hypothetical protein
LTWIVRDLADGYAALRKIPRESIRAGTRIPRATILAQKPRMRFDPAKYGFLRCRKPRYETHRHDLSGAMRADSSALQRACASNDAVRGDSTRE